MMQCDTEHKKTSKDDLRCWDTQYITMYKQQNKTDTL